MQITIEGDRLDGIVQIKESAAGGGVKRFVPLPEEASPPCDTCPKPELSAENCDVLVVYNMVATQQMTNDYSGHKLGLRFEAAVAAIEWAFAAGWILDRDIVMERIWILDEIARKHVNAKIDAQNAANNTKTRL